MGSILQNIESTVKSMDADVQNREALEMLICYLAYCTDAHLQKRSRNSFWTTMAFIELPVDIINTLTKAGYISSIKTSEYSKPVWRQSAYFGYPVVGGYNGSSVYNRVWAFELSDTVKDAYYEFCDSEQPERAAKVLAFLQQIRGYIDNIFNEYLKQLASCC
jgi:hypothetical protein